MKRFARFIGKLPFSGKYPVRDSMIDVVRSSTPEERRIAAIKCLSFLALYVALHAFQLWLGVRLVRVSTDLLPKSVGVVFALVNFCVVLTQSYQFCRMVKLLIRRRGKYYCGGGNRGKFYGTVSERLMAASITVAGQAVFLFFARHIIF